MSGREISNCGVIWTETKGDRTRKGIVPILTGTILIGSHWIRTLPRETALAESKKFDKEAPMTLLILRYSFKIHLRHCILLSKIFRVVRQNLAGWFFTQEKVYH